MYNLDDSYNHRRRVPRRILWVIGVLVCLLIIAAIIVRNYYNNGLQPVSSSQQVVVLTIKTGSTSVEIANELQKQGLIRSGTMFQWYIRTSNTRDKLQAGTYALRPSMSVPEIVKVLVDGSVKHDLFTIVPGKRMDQIHQDFINAGFNPADVDAALKPERYAGHPALVDKPAGASLEGFLYPDSYQKTATTEPATIVAQALDQMAIHLTPSIRSAFAAEGLSVYQGITLASIVEQETGHASDAPKIAQVFLKRLKSDMQLGSDVTVLYGAILAGKTPSLTYQSAYNTHTNKGLPPSPISNVSDMSLNAVAHPADTDWLFFVAGDDGTTYFSKTVEDHEALTQKYCKKLCSQVGQ